MKERLTRVGAALFALGVVACESNQTPEPVITPRPGNLYTGDGFAILRVTPDRFIIASTSNEPVEKQATGDMGNAMVFMAQNGCRPEAVNIRKELDKIIMEVIVREPSGCLPDLAAIPPFNQ